MSQQINLYSPIFRKQTKVFAAKTMLQALAIMFVVVAIFYQAIAIHTTVLESRATDSSRQLQSELERLKALGAGATPAERARALAERRKALESKLAAQKQTLAAFDSGVAGRAEGYSEPLRALARASVEGVWLTRIEFAKGELSVAGRATRPDLVPAYLERLREEKTLRAREFGRLELARAAPAKAEDAAAPRFVEFTLSAVPAAANPK